MVMVMAMVIVIVMFPLVAQHAEQGSFVSWHGDARPTSPDPGACHFTGEGGNLRGGNEQRTNHTASDRNLAEITYHHTSFLSSIHIHPYIQNVHAHRLPYMIIWLMTLFLDPRRRPQPPTNTILPKQPAHFEAAHSALPVLTQLTN